MIARGSAAFRACAPFGADARDRTTSRSHAGRWISRPVPQASSIPPFGRSQTGRNMLVCTASCDDRLPFPVRVTRGVGCQRRSAPCFGGVAA